MKQMNRRYFCKQYVVQALRNTHTQFRWHCFPRLFYLMPALVLSVCTQLREALVSMLESSRFPTCSSNAAQIEVQGTSLLSRERPPSQPANRAMRFSVSFFTFFTLLTFFTSSLAETFVSGEVSGVWNVEGSPYLVTDTLTVPEGDTLRVEPGVTITFLDQTDSTRTPFIVEGTLLALGTEGDSIRFTSPECGFFGIYVPFEQYNATIHMEYCVIDSAYNGIWSNNCHTVVKHCCFTVGYWPVTVTNGNVRVEYCTFFKSAGGNTNLTHAVFSSGDSVSIHDVYAPTTRIQIGSCGFVDTVFNIIADQLNMNFSAAEIKQTEVKYIHLSSGSYHMYDLGEESYPAVRFYRADILAEDCHLSNVILSESSGVIRNNEINGASVSFRGVLDLNTSSDVDIYNNIFNGTVTAISIGTTDNVAIWNNTLLFGSNGIYQTSSTNISVWNNIFQGDGVSCTGINCLTEAPPEEIHYNTFHNLSQVTNGFELDETNLVTDPFLAGGDPFDYHLQANSPCIDAGDPESPDDPDGTRADIGCFYYDQSLDNPPVQTIPEEVFAQTGQLLRIQIIAIDDNGPFSFTLPDLPDWLTEEDELDWVSDTTVVSGTVPEDAEDFSFTVIVEDGEGQTDTSLVTVDVDQRNLLYGEISGVLHVEDSPFYVVEDIVVPEGDSLVIEPGCELQFRYVEDEEQRIRVYCNGSLICEGVEGDSVFLRGSIQDLESEQWSGIELTTTSNANIAYTRFENAAIAIQTSEECDIHVANTLFSRNNHSIVAINDSTITINLCSFRATNMSNTQIILNNSKTIITNTIFYAQNHIANIRADNESVLSISDCKSYNNGYVSINMGSYGEIRRCSFYQTRLGVTFANHATGIVSNCLFNGLGTDTFGAGVSVPRKAIHVENNVFVNSYSGVRFLAVSSGDTLPIVVNNLFLGNHYAIQAVDGSEDLTSIEYNNFFENDSLVYQCTLGENNMFLDPCIVDVDSFYLYNNSPLIDAGYPGLLHNDKDSTRNDIGLWGGPHGKSYVYPLSVYENEVFLPSEFAILSTYPNPFNSSQVVTFTTPELSAVEFTLFNLLGQSVLTIDWPSLQPGFHHKSYNASGFASGVYFVQLSTGKESQIRRVFLIK